MKSIKECAQVALDVQNACNLSGVLASWLEVREALNKCSENSGTAWFRTHPINQLFASKVHDLCAMGISETDAFSKAYKSCEDLASQ
jgi:hypothetical protein